MSRDGLCRRASAKFTPNIRRHFVSTILTGAVVAACSSTMSTEVAGNLTSMGTLFAFVLVCLGVLVLRKSDPTRERRSRPLVPVVPVLGMATCLGMMAGLDKATWLNFFAWLAIGLVIYFSYGKTSLGPREISDVMTALSAADFDYELPDELIATRPQNSATFHARLLFGRTGHAFRTTRFRRARTSSNKKSGPARCWL